jgi:hypothetical protein
VAVPELARWVLTASLAVVAGTCLLRLISSRGRRPAGVPGRHEDVGQVVMGVSMIAMVLSWTDVLPKPLWVLLFAAQAVGFGALLLRGGPGGQHENWNYTHHIMASAAMVYMVVAMTGPVMTGMPVSPLAAAFGVYFLIYSGWSLVRATRVVGGVTVAAGEARLPAVLRQPMLIEGCRALMGGGMAFLLLAAG